MINQTQMIDLGAHTVDVAPDQAVTIANETFVMQLDGEEAYRLLAVLLELFSPACSCE